MLIPDDNMNDLADEVRKSIEGVGTKDAMTNICESLLHIVVPENGRLHDVEREQAVQVARATKSRKR